MMRGSGESCKWGMVMVGYIQEILHTCTKFPINTFFRGWLKTN